MSDENKITTNRIEEVLLRRKQNEFREELKAAIDNLNKVLYKYCGSLKHPEEIKELKNWFEKYAMSLTAPCSSNMIFSNLHPDHYPKCLNEALLKQAVDEFFKSFGQMKEQLEEIYGSIDC